MNHSRSIARNRALLSRLALLWFAGLYLRLPVFAASPLAPRIATDVGLGEAATGALTTLPILMLALGSLPSSVAASRLGARATMATGLLVVAIASAGRGWAAGAEGLLLATAIMGLGIAAMQTAVPSVVADWTPGRAALGSAVYLNGMMTGEFVGAGLTLPLALPLAGGDWRVGLALWSLPAAAIALLLLLPRHAAAPALREDHRAGDRPDWRSGPVWRLGLLLGSSIATFFAVNAYMGSVLAQRGELEALPGAIALFNLAAAAASVVMLRLAGTWVGRPLPLSVSIVAGAAGLLGFLFVAGPLAIAAVVVTGFAATVQLVLMISLLPRIASAGRLNGLVATVYTIGYAIGFLVPLAGGLIADLWAGAVFGPLPALALALATLPLALQLCGARQGPAQDSAVATCSTRPSG